MCDEYSPCPCLIAKKPPYKNLTTLLLDCWQREYAARPYVRFEFRRKNFEERMERSFDPVKDFEVIVRFLQQRPLLINSYFSGFSLIPVFLQQPDLLAAFVESLRTQLSIGFSVMDLPTQFFRLLQLNCPRMRMLKLSFEGTEFMNEDVILLRRVLIESNTLKCLKVTNCSITQCNFALLADGVHKSSSMRVFKCNRLLGDTLTLDSNKVAHVVSQLIWQNKLQKLKMQQCEFISSDMEIIAEYLHSKTSKLLNLNLAYNLIGPDGAEHLFRAIAHSGTLTHLNISGNGLGSHGGEVVAKYMSSCLRLTYLDISHNDIGHEAMTMVLTTLKKPIDWMHLKMCGNHFSPKFANILRRLLDARVVPQNKIDITPTFDEALSDYRVVPYY